MASTRSGEFEGYVLAVVGPDEISGCTAGAPVEFRRLAKLGTFEAGCLTKR